MDDAVVGGVGHRRETLGLGQVPGAVVGQILKDIGQVMRLPLSVVRDFFAIGTSVTKNGTTNL